jgi:SPRY domain
VVHAILVVVVVVVVVVDDVSETIRIFSEINNKKGKERKGKEDRATVLVLIQIATKMPSILNPETVNGEAAAADTAVSAADDATTESPVARKPEAVASSSKPKGSSSKRRTTSPTSTSQDVASSASQAIAAANLASAVQMAAALQLNGLLSLLTQSSTPGVAASVADPTVLQTCALSAALSSTSWQVPTPDQTRQAALKAVQECPPLVHLSKTDSAPQLKIMDADRLTLKGGMRGYRMARASHGVSQGCYYYEVVVLDPPSIQEIVASLPPNARLGASLQRQIQQALEYDKRYPLSTSSASTTTTTTTTAAAAVAMEEDKDADASNKPGRKRKVDPNDSAESTSAATSSKKVKTTPPRPQVGGHLRIGWSMRTGDLQAPVGYDKWSYGFRNLAGSKIHQSRREDSWGGEPWGPGDVVGCAIFLEGTPAAAATTDASGSPTANNNINNNNNNNHIRFFKNGAAMGHFVISKGKREGGAAFENIQPGTYYPAISSYLGGSVRVNFGPHFIHPPRKLPHGMSGKLQPISSLQPAPLTEEELIARLKKKNIFAKVAKEKETPEVKLAAFKEAVLAESQVLREAYQQHRCKHLQQVLEARKARNLNTTDLQQELDELSGTATSNAADGKEMKEGNVTPAEADKEMPAIDGSQDKDSAEATVEGKTET